MASATVMGAWTDDSRAYVAVQVAEGGNQGNKEYIGSVSLTDDLAAVGFAGQTWTQISAANKKVALVAAVKAVRDARIAAAQQALAGVTGIVTI
jgi:hypothetical protein